MNTAPDESSSWIGGGPSGPIPGRFRLDGRTAIVTGGQRGLGRAIGRGLAEAGANIGILLAPGTDGSDAVEEIRALGVDAIAVPGDVRDRASLAAGFDEIAAKWGRVDVVVANSGIGIDVRAEDMSGSEWDRIMNINLRGVFFTAQEAERYMAPNGGGTIVLISSNAGFTPTGNPQAAYNISKAGVAAMAKNLAYEWARFGIRVNAIAPGYTYTDIIKDYLEEFSDEAYAYMAAPSPSGRIATPDEHAATALYLASDASSHTTGQTIVVDGGYTITALENRMRR